MSPKKKLVRGKKKQEEEKTYNDYHLDVWSVISEFIRPEDVQRFSMISLKTAFICGTAKFWINLYKNNYDPKANLPEELQKENLLNRVGGIRAKVIRSLFIMYPPFKERRLKNLDIDNYDTTYRKSVIGMSQHNEKNVWTYLIKLKNRSESRRFTSFEKKLSVKEQLINRDIFCNPEESCQLLEIRSLSFMPLPQFQEEEPYIKSVLKLLSAGFRYYKVKIIFSNYLGNQVLGEPLIFDPVASIRVFNWWDPEYSNAINSR